MFKIITEDEVKARMEANPIAVEISEEEYRQALERGQREDESEPRAVSAYYDRNADRIVIELRTGAAVSIPRRSLQGLEDAAPDDVANLEVIPFGMAIHWRSLNQDFTVPGLVAGIFGNQAWMTAQTPGSGRSADAGARRVTAKRGSKKDLRKSA